MVISLIGPSTLDGQVGVIKFIIFGMSNRFRLHHHLIIMKVGYSTSSISCIYPTIVIRTRPISIGDLHGIQHVARMHVPEYIYIEEYLIELATYYSLLYANTNPLVITA